MFRIRLKRIITIVFLLFVKNLILISITAYSPAIQSFLAHEATKFITKKYDIDLSIEKLYLKIPNKIVLNTVNLNDSTGAVILQSDEINITISSIKIFESKLFIDEVNIIEPLIDARIDSNGRANYKYIFDKFRSQDKDDNDTTSNFGFDIYCNSFSVVDAHFKYNDQRVSENSGRFNLSDMDVNGVNLKVSDFKYYSDTIELNIDHFNFTEHSGLTIDEFSLHFKYYDTGMVIDNLIFRTINSEIISSNIELKGTDKGYLSDPVNKLTSNLNLDKVVIDFSDLSPFVPEYKNIHEKVYLSGNFSGKLSNIKIRDFDVLYGNHTKINANFSIDGLPDYDLAFIFANISTLETTSEDISKILKIASPKKPVELPDFLNELNHVSFTGNLTGLLNDLVAYGQFNTGLGSIRTDLAIATDFDKKSMSASGRLRADDIQLGKITGDMETFGLVSFNTTLRGQLDSLGNFNANIDCNVSRADLMGYTYSGISIEGLVSNDFFDGELIVDDPNLQVEFLGKYNYNKSEKINELSFSTDIWANLSNLHLLSDTLNAEVKFVLSSDLRGDFKSLPQGNVHLSELKFNLKDDVLKLYQLNLNSYMDPINQQYLTLRSDYLDMNLYGEFKINELVNIFTNMAHNYVPAYVNEVEKLPPTTNNSVNFDFRLKNLNELTRIFVPELNINNDLFIEGMISGQTSMFDATLSIPVISYDSVYLWGSELQLSGFNDSLDIKFLTQEISTGSYPLFENLSINFDITDNKAMFELRWDNHDTIHNAGDIRIETRITKNDEFPIPKIESNIYNSSFVVRNRLWEIAESFVSINPNDMHIIVDGFSLQYQNQSISISGEASQDKSKLMRFSINNVDISSINPYIINSGYQISGILSGNGRISDIYNVPSLRSSLSINDLKVNNEEFGRFDLSGIWNGETSGFNIEGTNKYIKLKGVYSPENDNIDINVLVDNFKLELLEPYLNEYDLSDLKGAVNISILIHGNTLNPDMSGYVDFDKAELTYDYLKLKALLNDRVEINNSSILFKDFKITDEFNNPGVINGGFYHNNFKNFRFDFLVNTQKMKLLNTTEKDNSSYYGTAYATAEVRIAGDVKKFGIDAVAKTEPNTVFVLPMTNTYDGGGVSYLTFIKPSLDSSDIVKIQPVKSSSDFYFKLDIEVTPDAEVQIVFDPKVGDLIRGYAKGNLKMEYTSDQEFYMYGEAEIVEGDYLFTLQNIINKKFYITPGGTITWSGEPTDATLDLDAVYTTRASLKELMAEVADSSNMYKSANVECHMYMTGKLMSPELKFSIEIPGADDKVKAQLANMSQDDITNQLLFLLVMNRFMPTTTTPGINNNVASGSALEATTFELLSNQISNWLSQISKDFDIGFKYNPGTEVSGQELEIALSTQILNDRVLINGNVGYGVDNKTNANTMVGDIEVQLKVNPSGSFRVKGFSRANDELETEYGPYTSGVGVFYTKDFNTFRELITDFWRTITFKNFRERKKNKKLLSEENVQSL